MRHNLHLIIEYCWLTVGVLWVVTAFAAKQTVRRDASSSRMIQVLLVVAAFALLFADETAIGILGLSVLPRSLLWTAIGVMVALAGFAFAVSGRFYLGANWSSSVTVKQNHELVRSGPYRFVRHPIYSGLLLAMLGTALDLGQVRGFLALLLAFTSWKLKSTTEELFMQQQFGTEYLGYKQRVKGLIPFVW
ncbi:MAG: isoprenylcysteine carboxylmethyltransferase family protein [Acidobacteriaceae bacterium]|nr:isoprenylcysteine carboxylmethyltransferase family protein [Acidobacteriaceae bacterium]